MKRLCPDKYRGLTPAEKSRRVRRQNRMRCHIGGNSSVSSNSEIENLYSPEPHVLPSSEVFFSKQNYLKYKKGDV